MRLCSALGLFFGLATRSPPASAFHTADQPITDDTAYTLPKHQVRLGIWKAEYGIFSPLTAGSYVWPWFFAVSNLQAKLRFYQGEAFAISASAAFFHFDTKSLRKLDSSQDHATVDVVPYDLLMSYRFNDRYTLSLDSVFTNVRVDGSLRRSDFSSAGEGAVDNYQLSTTFEWRYTRVTAFVANYRYLVFQRSAANLNYEAHPDAYTTVVIRGNAQTDALDFRGAASLTLSSVMSWQYFNLRLGVGYGHYNVPGVNFVLGKPSWFPDLDAFWLF
ncbi:MAG TPA: hypothetical protein VHV51_02960 [Polyangiaceae bacterium]|nr:hypothetical protein [Polyangiaceae bacterium]